jgi:hypothetical protein
MNILKLVLFCTVCILAISCNQKANEPEAKEIIKPNEVSIPKPEIDTAKILDLIELNQMPEMADAGGNTKEVKKRSIKFYNDSNKDTTLIMLQIEGMEISNKSVPNYGPDKPFEKTENWKLYKVDGKMKAFKN